MVMLVASVIVYDRVNRRVVLLRRGENKAYAPGMWSLPSGKGAPGEPITHTAVRELREETGLVVAPQALRLAHVTHSADSPEAPEGFVVLVFAAEEWGGEPVNAEPGKHSAVAWVDTDDLPTDFVPSTPHALERYLASERPEVAMDGWDGAQGRSLAGSRDPTGPPAPRAPFHTRPAGPDGVSAASRVCVPARSQRPEPAA
ncbi:NUDIX domain-containing protein [Embleya sp. NPDC005575]|uniref:NUDIX domain-containing protein n=1 Tax=Embleya sp. NPDC005575 TaxID=3156892 RepID=UPI0033AC2AD8